MVYPGKKEGTPKLMETWWDVGGWTLSRRLGQAWRRAQRIQPDSIKGQARQAINCAQVVCKNSRPQPHRGHVSTGRNAQSSLGQPSNAAKSHASFGHNMHSFPLPIRSVREVNCAGRCDDCFVKIQRNVDFKRKVHGRARM